MKEEEFRKIVKDLRIAIAAVDVVVFSILNEEINVFLTPIHRPPHYQNTFGLPGGVIREDEFAEDAATRHLVEKTHISDVFLEQLFTFSNPNRDKRSRSISVSYLALLSPDKFEKQDSESGVWVPIKKLPALAYDHAEIISVGLDRLKGKLVYTNLAKDLVSKEFTLPELQRVYEIVLERTLDKRNFRKKFLNTDLIKEVGKTKKTSHRPAQLYKFTSNKAQIIPEVWSAL